MTEADPVGSVGEEALLLLRALGSHGTSAGVADPGTERAATDVPSDEPHACPTGWCPICQVVGFVRDNPEAVAQVTASAGSMLNALRALLDAAVTPKERP